MCFACEHHDQLCEEVSPEERELFNETVFSKLGTDRKSEQELAVLGEPEFRKRWSLVGAHSMTKAAGCDLTEDGVHYEDPVVADEVLAALSLEERPGLWLSLAIEAPARRGARRGSIHGTGR